MIADREYNSVNYALSTLGKDAVLGYVQDGPNKGSASIMAGGNVFDVVVLAVGRTQENIGEDWEKGGCFRCAENTRSVISKSRSSGDAGGGGAALSDVETVSQVREAKRSEARRAGGVSGVSPNTILSNSTPQGDYEMLN